LTMKKGNTKYWFFCAAKKGTRRITKRGGGSNAADKTKLLPATQKSSENEICSSKKPQEEGERECRTAGSSVSVSYSYWGKEKSYCCWRRKK